MTESTDLVVSDNTMGMSPVEYKQLRERIIGTCEEMAGGAENDFAKMCSMQFYTKLEECIRKGCLEAATDGPSAQRGFIHGLKSFFA